MFELSTTLHKLHATLINRLITANLEKAQYYIEKGQHRESQRHHRHAKRIANKHAPQRLSDIQRLANHHEVLR